jgi:hypothetical protein
MKWKCSCLTTNFYLGLFEDELPDDTFQHNLFSLGQFLSGLSRWSGNSVGDDRHDHEDVTQPEQNPDDEAWIKVR